MKKITITLDDKVAEWARRKASEKGESPASVIERLLQEEMAGEDQYRASMQTYLSQSPHVLKKEGSRYPPRDDLYYR